MSDQAIPSTVFVVDDDDAVRESLRWLVESIGLNVETYASAKSFLDNCDPERPGCLILDVRMPEMSGLDLQKRLDAQGAGWPIIVITAHGDVPTAVRAMRQGAVDFLEKPFNDSALLELVQHCVDRDRADRDHRSSLQAIKNNLDKLTPREREVLDRILNGKSNKETARELDVSPKTIEVHRARVMEKMRAGSLAELVQMIAVLDKE